MRITPMDIRQQQFTVRMFRGFDVQEVDTFLEDLAADYEALLKENTLLKEHLQAAEERMAAKRADYLAAGTLVVWDVDPLGPDTIRSYTGTAVEPTVFRRGEAAHAEPAVRGWRFRVDELFE